MYSYEIDKIIKSQNYNIDSVTYLNICNTSPQINHVKYSAFEDYFEFWDNEGSYWKFNVYRKEN